MYNSQLCRILNYFSAGFFNAFIRRIILLLKFPVVFSRLDFMRLTCLGSLLIGFQLWPENDPWFIPSYSICCPFGSVPLFFATFLPRSYIFPEIFPMMTFKIHLHIAMAEISSFISLIFALRCRYFTPFRWCSALQFSSSIRTSRILVITLVSMKTWSIW